LSSSSIDMIFLLNALDSGRRSDIDGTGAAWGFRVLFGQRGRGFDDAEVDGNRNERVGFIIFAIFKRSKS